MVLGLDVVLDWLVHWKLVRPVLRKKSSRKSRAALQSYVCGVPLDRLHLDFLWPIPISRKGNKYILVITDQFTKWVEAYAVPDQRSETITVKLVEEFVTRFGAPLEIHTDQARI